MKYKLWINCVCGHSPKLIGKCMSLGASPEDIFRGNIDEFALRRVLGDAAYRRLIKRDLSDAEEILDYCKSNGIRILSIDDESYPELLRHIYEPPRILYTKGDELNLNDFLTVSVVGMRRGSEAGIDFTHKLSYELASNGIIIVSGMAEGLDGAAHIGALAAKQKTVAVLAGGVEIIYPKKNEYIYESILSNGMIVSERPPHAVGKSEYYRERNRIIAGLSYGTIVIEGAVRSGTSITAGLAYEFNRDIFAVPGSPTNINSLVPNSFLQNGAIVTLSAKNVLDEYKDVYPQLLENGKCMLKGAPKEFCDAAEDFEIFDVNIKLSAKKAGLAAKRRKNAKNNKNKAEVKIDKDKAKEKPNFEKYNQQERLILECLYKRGESMHIDEIITETGVSSSAVNSIMVMLQMKGAVKQNTGNLYILAI